MPLMKAEAWTNFYLAGSASAAVLIGLLFVALSINREAIGAQVHLGGEARQAIFALVSVLLVSLVVLIPDQSSSALGAELLGGALLSLGIAVPRQVRRVGAMVPAEESIATMLADFVRASPSRLEDSRLLARSRTRFAVLVAVFDSAFLMIIAAGASLAAGFDSALYVLAAAVIALMLLAIFNSWELTLVRVE